MTLKTLDGIEKFLKALKDAQLKTADGQKVVPMTSAADLSYKTPFLQPLVFS